MYVRSNSNQKEAGARILLASCREADPVVGRCLRFEFEDSAMAVDSVDMVCPGREAFAVSRSRRLVARLDAAPLPRFRRTPSPRYKMFVACIQGLDDLYRIAPASPWRHAAEVSVCCIDEVYARQVPQCTGAMALLRPFDLIFVGCHASVDALSRATGRPCHYLPPSVDTQRFCPYPDPPARVIDVYSMGRRSPRTHETLLEMSERDGWFYHFDTTQNAMITDHHEHRRRLADLVKRTRYFLVNVAHCDTPQLTGGQQELGYRYFEGAAAGTVLIGQLPGPAAASSMFDWPDAVVPLPYDSDEIGNLIRELDAAPQRVERIRRDNVVHALRRHDHVHRWARILEVVGLDATPALHERRRTLNETADKIEGTAAGHGRAATVPSGPAPGAEFLGGAGMAAVG